MKEKKTKKLETPETQSTAVPDQNQEPVLSEVALGTFRNYTTGEWCVAKIKYNPLTGETGKMEIVPAGPGRDFAIEKFKMVAVEEGLVG